MKRFLVFLFSLVFYTQNMFAVVGVLDTATFNASNGYITTDIGTATTDVAHASAVQPDGKIVVVGTDGSDFALVRYTIEGALDTTFGTGGKVTTNISGTDIARAVTIQVDGKIVVAGSEGSSNFVIARYNADGSLDTSFDTDGIKTISVGTSGAIPRAIVLSESSSIYIAGTVDANKIIIVALNPDGSNQGTFGTSAIATTVVGTTTKTYAMALQSDGKIVVAGSSDGDVIVARYSSLGVLDTAGFNASTGYKIQSLGGTDIAYGVALQSDQKIVIAGTDSTNAAVARFTTAGALDTTFGVLSTGYNIANTFGGTVAISQGLVIQSDDKIVVGATVTNGDTDFGIARYLADGTALDTTFNPSTGYTITDIGSSSTDTVGSITLQENNRFIVAGTSADDFATARYLGDAAPQGCIDVTYSTDGYVDFPAGATSGYKPQVTAIQAQSDSSVLVGSKDLATTVGSRLVKLNSAGSASGAGSVTAVTITEDALSDAVIDGNGRALVIGTDTGAGWVRRYDIAAGSPGSFTADASFGTSGLVTETTNSSSFTRVGEQSTGQIIVMGQSNTATTGLIIAYNQNGTIDTGFGTSGLYTMATTTFTDMVIGSDDSIFVIYATSTTNVTVAKIKSDGSGLDLTYNSTGIVSRTLSNDTNELPYITLDNSGKVAWAIARVNDTITLNLIATDGLSSTTQNINSSTSLLESVVITQIQSDTDNQIIVTGYDKNSFYLFRYNSAFTGFDTTFAPNAAFPGILRSMYNDINPTDFINGTAGVTPHRVVASVSIAGSGNILFGGYEAIDTTNTVSLVAQVVGDTTPVTQVPRYPGYTYTTGQIDQDFGTAGNLSLGNIVATGSAKAMQVLGSGKILVAVDTGADTSLVQLDSDYTADTASFGSGTGIIALTGFANPTNVLDDVAGNIYVVGDNGSGATKLKKITSTGSAITWTASTNEVIGNEVVQQGNGTIVMAGKDGSSGVLVGYNSVTGGLDSYFGTAGIFSTGVNAEITNASVITSSNKIVYAYRDGTNNAIVNRLMQNGSVVDSTFTFGTPIASVSANDQIRMQLDINGKVVVVARTSTAGDFIAQRYLASGADDVGPITITLTNPTTSTLQNILCLSDGSTLILGSNSNGTTMILARLTPAFALDTAAFDVPNGVLETTLPTMNDFYSLGVVADQRIIIGGDNSTTPTPYFSGVVNDVTVTAVNQSVTALDVPGRLDTTLNPWGTNPGVVDLLADMATTNFVASQAKKILNTSGGSYFVAADNGTNTQITKFDSTDTQISTFGTSGILTISSKADVSDLFINQDGGLLVCGGSGSSGSNDGWIDLYNASTGVINSTFTVASADNIDISLVVAQQTSGRILVAGQQDGVGVIIGYNSITGAIDQTFGVAGVYSTGYAASVNGMIIDLTDNVYFILNNGTTATTKKLDPDGTTVAWTGSTTILNSSVNSNNHIAFDPSNDIIIVAVDTTTPQIVIKNYAASNGVEAATVNLVNGTTGFTTPVVTSLAVDTAGKIVFSGYDDVANDTAYVARVLASITGGLDTTFNPGPAANPGIQPFKISGSDTVRSWNSLMINSQGDVTTVGYVTETAVDTPYLMRLFGDPFVGQQTITVLAGAQGILDPTFGTAGTYDLDSLDASLADTSATCIIAPITGGYYIGFDDGASTSQLIKMTNDTALDESYNTTGIAQTALQGVFSMQLDGDDRMLLAGTTGAGAGWIKRYTTAGVADTTFNATGSVTGLSGAATTVIQQTLGRVVVAGKDATNGVVRGYTSTGTADSLFGTSGVYSTGIANGIYALAADQYDRLLIAYKNSTNIDVARLTSSGYLDISFDTDGIISSAIASADDEVQVRIARDVSDNIIVATHVSTTGGQIAIRGYDTTGTSIYTQLNITTLTSPTLTNLVATADGKVLVSGYQSSDNAMWVARITAAGALDSTFGTSGLMTFTVAGATQTSRILNALSVRYDGRLAIVGYELTGGVKTPYLARAYDDPYTTQQTESPDSKPVGTNDLTLGLTGTNGVLFFASAGADATELQVSQAVAMQGDDKIVVALDGQTTGLAASQIFINKFTIDGTPDTTFNSTGKATISLDYQNEYVRDMVTFATPAGVNKAILAGYVTNTTLSIQRSLLLQYDLDTVALDTSFGGLSQNPTGVAFGHALGFYTVGQQTNGRVVASGLNYDSSGVVIAYSSIGDLDQSFGTGGFYNTGTVGIYTHVIDTSNRIIIVYNNGSNVVAITRILADGSGPDLTFNTTGTVTTGITGISGNTNMKIVFDGSGNVIVAAVNNSGVDFVATRYTSTGALDVSLTITSANLGTVTALTVAELLVNSEGKVVVVGYDNDATNDDYIIVQTNTALTSLDTTFNPTPGTPGYLKYKINSGNTVRQLTSALIHPDGRIISVGSETL